MRRSKEKDKNKTLGTRDIVHKSYLSEKFLGSVAALDVYKGVVGISDLSPSETAETELY